jgi:hypothetical protein
MTKVIFRDSFASLGENTQYLGDSSKFVQNADRVEEVAGDQEQVEEGLQLLAGEQL